MATLVGEPQSQAFTADMQRQILGTVTPVGTEVSFTQQVPEAVLQTQVSSDTLSPQGIVTQRKVLHSEVRLLMGKDITTLLPHEKTLLNQINKALGADSAKVDDERLAIEITKLLQSPDNTVKQVMGKIADITARVQLARIQVGTDATFDVKPADPEAYVPREAYIASTSAFGDPTLPKPKQKTEMKGWRNAPKRALNWLNGEEVGKGETRLAAFLKSEASFNPLTGIQGVTYQELRQRGQRTHAGVTVDFPANAVLGDTRTLEGNKDYVGWIAQQKDIKTAVATAISPQDLDRVRAMAQERLAAIMEYATVHQGRSLDKPEDFQFIKPGPAKNTDAYECTGPVRDPYNTRIEGLVGGESFPANFHTQKPADQLVLLTDVLERRAMKDEQEKARQQSVGQRIETHLAEVRAQFEQSRSVRLFAVEIAEQTQKIEEADASIRAIDAYRAAVKDDDRLTREVTSAESDISATKTEITSRKEFVGVAEKKITDIHAEFSKLETEKSTEESTIHSKEQQQTALRSQLQGLQSQQAPDAAKIATCESQIQSLNTEIYNSRKRVSEIETSMKPLRAGETLYQELVAKLQTASTRKKQLEAQLKAAKATRTEKETQLPRGITAADIDDEKKVQEKKAELAQKKAAAEAEKRTYESQEGKGDAGIKYRESRLQAVKDTLFDVSKYQDVLKRTEQGVVDIVIPDPAVAPAGNLARTAHPAGPDILLRHTAEGGFNPAYLQMVYVLMGPQALKMGPEGANLFRAATHIISPEEFYAELRNKPEWASVQTQINTKVGGVGYPGPDIEIPSIHSDEFHKDPDIMNAMMGIMKPDLISDILNQAQRWAADGYLTGPQKVYADEIARMSIAASEVRAQQYEAVEQGDVQQSQERIASELAARVKDIMDLAVPDLADKPARLNLAAAIQRELVVQNIAVDTGITDPVVDALVAQFNTQGIFNASLDSADKKKIAVTNLALELLKSPVAIEDLDLLRDNLQAHERGGSPQSPLEDQISGRIAFAQGIVQKLSHLYFEGKYDDQIALVNVTLPLLGIHALSSINDELKIMKTTGVRPSLDILLAQGGARYLKIRNDVQVTQTNADTFANGMADIIDPSGTNKTEVAQAYKISSYHLQNEMNRNQFVRDFDRMFAHVDSGPELALQIKSATGCSDQESAILVKRIKEKRAFRAGRT